MTEVRTLIVLVGVFLPYLARVPFGMDWVRQYLDTGVFGFLFLNGFNAIAWGGMIWFTFRFTRVRSALPSCVLGFAFLGWAHAMLDLAADGQAAIALVFIPIYAWIPIGIGAWMGSRIEKRLNAAAADR